MNATKPTTNKHTRIWFDELKFEDKDIRGVSSTDLFSSVEYAL